jgi:hypothetical protein
MSGETPAHRRREFREMVSDTNGKFVVAYIVLVALPVLGLAGILNYGRGLHAPLSVDGVWHFETGSHGLARLPCVSADVFADDGSVVISQSGGLLALKVGGAPTSVAIGSIEENTITASFLTPEWVGKGASCGKAAVVTLTATVAPDPDPRVLIGVLALQDCTSCAVVEFKAVRQVRKTPKREH